jgi:hypothetical protein
MGDTPPGDDLADWTVIAVLAGDNNLSMRALDELAEMEKVGSTDRVRVLAQVDRADDPYAEPRPGDWSGTRRYLVGRTPEAGGAGGSTLLAELGTTNTGDAATIEDFVAYCAANHPSRRTLLVLWNHGTGFYVSPEWRSPAPDTRAIESKALERLGGSFFHQTRAVSMTEAKRGILYDEGARDCLDNQELARVCAFAKERLGRKIDILGMDACLMTMIEVAWQVRDSASLLVGSEDLEPVWGWPYDAVLADLVAAPELDGEALARRVVSRYLEYLDHPGVDPVNVTSSVLDLARLGDTVGAVDTLAGALLDAGLDALVIRPALYAAVKRSTRFYRGRYVDLWELAENLGRTCSNPQVQAACAALVGILSGPDSPILVAGHRGDGVRNTHGLSINFPLQGDPAALYDQLAFARDTRWGELVRRWGEV